MYRSLKLLALFQATIVKFSLVGMGFHWQCCLVDCLVALSWARLKVSKCYFTVQSAEITHCHIISISFKDTFCHYRYRLAHIHKTS